MKKKKKRNIPIWTVGIVIVFAAIIMVVVLINANDEDIISIEEFERRESIDATIKSQYQPTRNYGYGKLLGSKYEVIEIFKNLPPLPEDFYRYKYLLMSGRIQATEMCVVGEEYYTQPEFIGSTFVNSGLHIYKNPDPYHWTPEGYGTFPHESETITKAGSIFEVCTFFHSSFGVESYQGFSVNPIYIHGYAFQGKNIVTSPNAEKYISINIEPNSVLLTPTYVTFQPGWSQRIKMIVNVSEETPAGRYIVGYDVGRAPVEDAKEWRAIHKEKYFSKSGFGVSGKQFILVITVEE